MMKPTDFCHNNRVLPGRMCVPLLRYLDDHLPVGDFLQAVIANDLREAVFRADDENIELIPVYVMFLHLEAPASSWGSHEAYDEWISDRYFGGGR